MPLLTYSPLFVPSAFREFRGPHPVQVQDMGNTSVFSLKAYPPPSPLIPVSDYPVADFATIA